MRILLASIIIMIVSTFAVGQDLKLKKQKEHTRNGKATYYVIKEEPSIKHGTYFIKAWSGNDILLKGEYNMGKRAGKWTEKYYGKMYNGSRKSTGNYENNQKIGKWYYFDHNGDTAQIYDHSEDVLLYSVLENRSEYVGGLTALSYELVQAIELPPELRNSGKHFFSFNTKIEITLNSNNRIEKISFSEPIGYGVEEVIKTWLNDDSKQWIASKEDKNILVALNMNWQF